MEAADARYRKTHAKIKEAFETLIMKTRYENISVCAIADEAGVNRKTFYLHFRTKEAILDETLAGVAGRILEYVDSAPPARGFAFSREFLDGFVTLLEEKRAFHRRLLSPDYSFAFQRVADGLWRGNVERLRRSVDMDDFATRAAILYAGHGAFNVVREWLIAGSGASKAELCELLERLAADGPARVMVRTAAAAAAKGGDGA